jgi:radical SAM superfamily enzyme YgiQ (UPF0313 family)
MLQALLVNPPIYDFTAYDFWLRPYGMLRVAGQIRGLANLSYFDYLIAQKKDKWGRGPYFYQETAMPKCLDDIPRRFRRFGQPRAVFREFLKTKFFDVALVQTMMTYWYLGVQEVIEDIRELRPSAKIVLGGTYATLCPSHAQSLGADLLIQGSYLTPLWQLLSIEPQIDTPFLPPNLQNVGIIKITEGCPFRCSYCASSIIYPEFQQRPTADCIKELDRMTRTGVRNVAFYDDALLFNADQALIPFLREVIQKQVQVSFHTPNALNARFVTSDLANLMVKAGFANFYFGLESSNVHWQRETGGKVNLDEFETAVEHLKNAGAKSIVTYIIVGHPDTEQQDLESSMNFAHRCGAKVMLSEFSPIPGTIDGDKCGRWADPDEPLSHNKTAFAIRRIGPEYLNELKTLSHKLNSELKY